ncbi:IS66 family insertion sequence element accessory protein TnpA, partial [Vibrio quintilis]
MASLNPHIWLKHIESWKQSGMTQAQYCREHHLSAKAFYYWKTKAQRHEKA